MPKTIPTFDHNGQVHRVIGRRVKDPDAAFGEARYNLLQRRVSGLRALFGRWETVQEERVPDHVIISLGTLGDTGGWVSALPRAGFAK